MHITTRRLTPLALVLALLATLPATAQSQSEEQARHEAELKQREIEKVQKELELKQREFEVQQKMTERQRREVEEKLRAKAKEMREAQREVERLSRELAGDSTERALREREASRFVYFGGKARLGIVVNPGADPDSDALGAKIVGVTPGGPADEAGLETGDIVTKVNGVRLTERRNTDEKGVTPTRKLLDLLSDLEDGKEVELEYRRGKDTRNAKVVARSSFGSELKVMVNPDIVIPAIPDIPDIPDVGEYMVRVAPRVAMPLTMDLEMVSLGPELGRYFGTSEGILVLDAPRDSKLKLQPGDVIIKIDGREPSSPSKVLRILRSYEPGENVSIEIMRDRKPMELTVTLPERKAGMFVVPSGSAWSVPEAPAAPKAATAPRPARGTSM
jgi:C-terminal processing protease CtpA/Prc